MSDIEEDQVQDEKKQLTEEEKTKELEAFKEKYAVTWWGEIKTTLIFMVSLVVLCGTLFLVLFFLEEFTRDRGTLLRFTRMFEAQISKDSLEENLKNITSYPHYAGTPGSRNLAAVVKDKLKNLLGDRPEVTVRTESYEVWLPFPKEESSLAFTVKGGGETYTATLSEPETPENKNTKDLSYRSIIAYSGSRNIQNGDLVYANYGRKEDFDKLKENNVQLNGKVVIVRYGKIFRGLKIRLAEQAGATGVILYNDPADDGAGKGATFPNGPWRPFNALERGSGMFLSVQPGDPTTPGFASLPGVRNRITREQATNLPKIPAIAISAKDAFEFLKTLGGDVVEDSWKGGLTSEGFEYRYGSPSENKALVNMNIQMEEKLETIHNVFARVDGSVEKDRIVMIGNHRDAWILGATDPHSGTISMLEIAKSLGEMMKNGYKPRRTIVFASWDAEEQGLIGSTEYVEQYKSLLSKQLVAYVNLDSSNGAGRFRAMASPSLGDVVREATKNVPFPKGYTGENSTKEEVTTKEDVYTEWKKEFGNDTEPVPEYVGSGSDYTAFFHHLGVSVVDVSFRETKGQFGTYHSRYDSEEYYSKFIDPDYEIAQSVAKIAGKIVLRLADDVVLPFKVEEQTNLIETEFNKLKTELEDASKSFKAAQIKSLNETLKRVDQSLGELKGSSQASTSEYNSIFALTEQSRNYDVRVRRYNDAVMGVERGFAVEKGLPGRPWYKHVICAPGIDMGYGYELFPAVREAIREKNNEKILNALDSLAEGLANANSIVSGDLSDRNTFK